ncbi:YjbH domain-containing protein [Rhodobacteraceae bacterium CCMM004]|nr:YjbH domain-containing protein [Rhodobacteraceae bacterium CCMM004]
MSYVTAAQRRHAAALFTCAAAALATAADADIDRPNLNFYGVTGIIDMPSALSQPDGELSLTVSHFAGITRNTLSFQILPRVQGSFRYSGFQDLNFGGFRDYYDRSFDISVLLLKESTYLPAVKVGLQDFVGTGLYSGEYVVATKTFGDRLTVSGGLGWGRLATSGSIGSPFGSRPAAQVGRGGKPNYDQWFRGPAAPFAGITYRATDRLTLLAEYSSDGYRIEQGKDRTQPSTAVFSRKSSLNFGFDYKVNDAVNIGAYYLYGSELGFNISLSLNPYRPPVKGSIGEAPLPIQPRPSRSESPLGWSPDDWIGMENVNGRIMEALSEELNPQGIIVESVAARGSMVDVRFRNAQFDASAQAVGRVARALTRAMPASVETFRIVPVVDGLPASAVTLRRTDIEMLAAAPDNSDRLLAVAGIGDAGPRPADATINDAVFPRFEWNLAPYVRNSYFDPDQPFRFDAGVALGASYEPVPGLIFSGAITKKVIGNLDENKRASNSQLPRVRTNFPLYDREGDPALERLTASYFFKPGKDLYGRVTAGYLERMFGGISAEVLYKPANSRLGIGAEVNYVRQRDFDLQFGFQDYDVVTGHVSAYYDVGNGFHAQLDVGRYLAGDLGATLTVDREFRNGWKVGAFATLTDVSSAQFGEGSFDKGIRLEIPLSWFTSRPTTRKLGTTIRPVTRDGGARLNVSDRLYPRVRDYHRNGLEEQWGRVWR